MFRFTSSSLNYPGCPELRERFLRGTKNDTLNCFRALTGNYYSIGYIFGTVIFIVTQTLRGWPRPEPFVIRKKPGYGIQTRCFSSTCRKGDCMALKSSFKFVIDPAAVPIPGSENEGNEAKNRDLVGNPPYHYIM